MRRSFHLFFQLPFLLSFLLRIAFVSISAVSLKAYAEPNLSTPAAVSATLMQNENAEVETEMKQEALDKQRVVLKRRRTQIEQDYLVQERACYNRFLVNRCLDKVHTARRAQQAVLRTEQLALNEAERAAHAQQRAQQTRQKQAHQAATAPARQADEERAKARYLEKQQQYELRQTQRAQAAPQHQANAQAYAEKQAAHRCKLEAARAQAAQEAQRRADNAKRFAAKQRAAALHRAEVERRKQARSQKTAPQTESEEN